MDCLQWNSILHYVNLLPYCFIYSFQIPLTCSQNSVIIIVTRLPAGWSVFEYWQGLIKYTLDLWFDISLCAVLEICCDKIEQLIHHKINSKIKNKCLNSISTLWHRWTTLTLLSLKWNTGRWTGLKNFYKCLSHGGHMKKKWNL